MARVAIAGYGREGQSSYRYYRARGDEVVIVDEREIAAENLPDGAETRFGDGVYGTLEDFDLVIRTPSLRPDKIVTRGKIWSQTNEFLDRCPAEIIGVTGTKGKGTTCSLIVSILRAAGKTVHLVGNIGTPALDVLEQIKPDDIVVYEMSSFQLWDAERSPQIAVVLMVEPDHLDVHDSMEEYIASKARIRQSQSDSDICLYHPTNQYAESIAKSTSSPAARYAAKDDGQVYVKENNFYIQDRLICATSVLKIPGMHNIENACAAISAALVADGSISNDQVREGLESFTGLPHRLKFVREVGGVEYYDDSIATTPGSAIAALRSFDMGRVVIVLGGSDKGASYEEVVKECGRLDASVIAIGQTGQEIARLCDLQKVPVTRVEGIMSEVVVAASQVATAGQVVVLSPASASFDQYSGYADRGDQFIVAVEELS